MDTPHRPSRRTLLTAGLGGAGALALAGCTASSAVRHAGASTPTDAASGGGATAADDKKPKSAGSSGGKPVSALDAVPVGGSAVVDGANGPVALARPDEKTLVGHTAICTHRGCTVKAAGKQLHCPCHGSVYDAFTGKVLGGPAPRPLAAVDVAVDGAAVIER